MAKYIDRGALIEWLKRIRLIDLSDGRGLCRVIMEDDFKKAIKKMPKGIIADVAPVRHGRWEEADWVEPDCHGFVTIITPKAALRCSNCKNCFKKELLWKDNYCPNCGAKMDGGDNDAAD